MKKIALYIPSMNGGGAERVMLTLANSLVEKGLNVDLVLNNAQGPYIKNISSKVNIVELKTSRAITSLIPLARYLRKDKPDTILSAMSYINIITIFARELSLTKTRVVISEHAHLSASLIQMKKPLLRSMFKVLMSFTYPYADSIVAVSNNVADDLSNKLGIERKKITTIYNPIVSSDLLEKINRPINSPSLISSSEKTIVSVGRLADEKNFPMLIRAFNEVQKKVDSRLFILGDGYAENELKNLVSQLDLVDKVIFTGFIDNPYAFVKIADLFVLTSNHEGFGNVLVESMACGTNVISTDCPGGPNEILEGGKWGRLVPVDDIASLSKAMIDSLTLPSHLSSEDLEQRASVFSVDNAVNSYVSILAN